MRLRPLSENECYCRCYGAGENTVKVFRAERDDEPDNARAPAPRLRLVFDQQRDVCEMGVAARLAPRVSG